MMKLEIEGLNETIGKFQNVATQISSGSKDIVKRRTYATERDAKKNVLVDTGLLKRSIRSEFKKNDLTGEVIVGAEHGIYVEKGTRPHTIEIKNSKVLSDGKNIFGRKVKHPGTKAQPFLLPAYLDNQNKLKNDVKKFLRKVTR